MREKQRAARAVMAAVLTLALSGSIGLAGRAWADAGSSGTGTTLLPTTTQPPSTTTTTLLPTTTQAPSTTTTPETTTTVATARPATTTRVTTPVATNATTPPTAAPTTATTTPSLLVPGPAATGQAVNGTKAAAVTNQDRTGTIVALVITGLLVVALLVSLLTWRFWRNTRPGWADDELAHGEDGDGTENRPATVGSHG